MPATDYSLGLTVRIAIPGALSVPAAIDAVLPDIWSTVMPAVSLLLHFLEGLTRVSERINSRGDAAIDGDLKQYLLDLVLGEPVLQGALDVQLQFVGTTQCAKHGQIDDAAGAAVESRPGPQRAPAEFGRPFRHRPREFVGACNGFVDVILAEYFLA